MEFGNLFKDSLTYPVSDWKKLLILGIFSIIVSLLAILSIFGIDYSGLSIVLLVVAFIVTLIINGYALSITKVSISKSKEVPSFDWVTNIIMGIKYLILSLVYFIIPAIITIIIALVTGLFGSTQALMQQLLPNLINKTVNQTTVGTALSAVSPKVIASFSASIAITVLIGIILYIIFNIIALVGACRMANTDSLIDGLNMVEIFKDISSIGWLNYIAWYIVFNIILLILAFISSLVSSIPFVGLIISALIISPFITMYVSRSLGLMYASKK